MADVDQDKLVSHNKFGLEIDGQDLYVLSISGFGSEINSNLLQAVDKTGKNANVNFVSNASSTPQPITAVRFIDGDPTWSDWYQQAVDGDTSGAKKNGAIHFYPAKGDSAEMSFAFEGAIPTKYFIDGIDANSNTHTTEQITFTVETLKKS